MTPEQNTAFPQLTISLDYYLTTACRGFDNMAVVSRTFGEYIKHTVDPGENFCHVELQQDTGLCYIYPINTWRENVTRLKRLKEQSELERQQRFEQAEKAAAIQRGIAERREILLATIAETARRFPKMQQMSWDEREYFCYVALTGESPVAVVKFGISQEEIEHFRSLPPDPDFKNKMYFGSQLTTLQLKKG